jgi:drug/metabolite transporter (DMT)-like permease
MILENVIVLLILAACTVLAAPRVDDSHFGQPWVPDWLYLIAIAGMIGSFGYMAWSVL